MQIFDWVTSSHYRLLALLRAQRTQLQGDDETRGFRASASSASFFQTLRYCVESFFLTRQQYWRTVTESLCHWNGTSPRGEKTKTHDCCPGKRCYGGLIISTHSVTKSIFLQVLDQGGTSYHHVSAKWVMTRRRRYWRHTRLASDWIARVSDTHESVSYWLISYISVFRKDCSPGPVYFIDPMLSRNGREGNPCYSMLGRQREFSTCESHVHM